MSGIFVFERVCVCARACASLFQIGKFTIKSGESECEMIVKNSLIIIGAFLALYVTEINCRLRKCHFHINRKKKKKQKYRIMAAIEPHE